jgi:hypothetical protein
MRVSIVMAADYVQNDRVTQVALGGLFHDILKRNRVQREHLVTERCSPQTKVLQAGKTARIDKQT